MCLSYNPFESVDDLVSSAMAGLRGHGSQISCDNTLCFILRNEDGHATAAYSIPVTGTECVVFPMLPRHTKHLQPCPPMKCVASQMHGLTNPSLFVPYEEEKYATGPRYRSLGGGSEDVAETMELKVFCNPDGGHVAILPVAKFIPHDIGPEQRAALAAPMIECIERGLEAASIDATRVFGPHYDKSDDASKFGFIGFLFDACTPDCDIVLGITQGLTPSGRFTFLYNSNGAEDTIPMPGLTHGDRRQTQEVYDTYYVATNDPSIGLAFPMDKLCEGEAREPGEDSIRLLLRDAKSYREDYFTAEGYVGRGSNKEGRDQAARFEDVGDDVPESGDGLQSWHDGERGLATHGNTVWEYAQKRFQEELEFEILDVVCEFFKETSMITEEGPLVDRLFVTNMKGTPVPRNTVFAECHRARQDDEWYSSPSRVKIARVA